MNMSFKDRQALSEKQETIVTAFPAWKYSISAINLPNGIDN